VTRKNITRRDFVNGCTLSLAAGTSVSPLQAVAQDLLNPGALPPDYYPPTRQGLRGSHEGSFEAAHELRDGKTWNVVDAGDPVYDLSSSAAASAACRQRTFTASRWDPAPAYSFSTTTTISAVTPSAMNSGTTATCSW
jgi:hypothetical protein